jgi:hypothetical protein
MTGAVPFKGTTYQEIVIAHIREAPDLSVLPCPATRCSAPHRLAPRQGPERQTATGQCPAACAVWGGEGARGDASGRSSRTDGASTPPGTA